MMGGASTDDRALRDAMGREGVNAETAGRDEVGERTTLAAVEKAASTGILNVTNRHTEKKNNEEKTTQTGQGE